MGWLEALGPSLAIVLGGIITWIIKSKIEELKAIEEKLRVERRNIYLEILDPYIRIFVDLKGKGAQDALKQITSYEYRKTAFNLNLFGSDDVVRAYNALMQHSYKVKPELSPDPKEMMRLWGKLLLEIRKSLGNENTGLNEIDMLRGFISDIEVLEN